MCSRADTEHLQPEAPAEVWCNDCSAPATLERDGTGYCADHGWAAERRRQRDERTAQVLAGALEDHRRAGL